MRILRLLLIVVLGLPVTVSAQEEWSIDSFTSDITIQQNGVVKIEEQIDADFGNTSKHGIIRNLPYAYTNANGRTVYTKITDIVVMQDNKEANVDISQDSGYVNIRIGDADKSIFGKHTYDVTYYATGVLQSFEGFDELQWNVTGNEWDVPINKVSATVHVPVQILQAACYVGSYGDTTACLKKDTEEHIAEFSSEKLQTGEGLTVAVGFEQGATPIIAVSEPLSLLTVLSSRGTLGFTAVFIGLGVWLLMRHMYRYGRDRHWKRAYLPGERSDRDGQEQSESILPLLHRRAVSPEYEAPDGLRPAEVGVLLDERADTLDISATIVDLAVRGFLEITEIPKKWIFGTVDYVFTRTDKSDDSVLPYEALLLERLFNDKNKVSMSELKQSFYDDLRKVKSLLYEDMVTKKLFPSNPDKVRNMYRGVGVIQAVLGGVLLFWLRTFLPQADTVNVVHQLIGGLSLAVIVTGILSLFTSSWMPRKTGYGRELYERVLGYDLFISSTEKYRAKFMENESLFMEVLPYAIVFGVTDKLAKAFKDMGIEPTSPTWYHGSAPFHAALFASNMNNFSSSLGTAMAAVPSGSGSSGGGFSGGGFGGGGGSSW